MTPSRWRRSSCAGQKQPPARIAVSVFLLITLIPPMTLFPHVVSKTTPGRPAGPAEVSGQCSTKAQARTGILVLGLDRFWAVSGGPGHGWPSCLDCGPPLRGGGEHPEANGEHGHGSRRQSPAPGVAR